MIRVALVYIAALERSSVLYFQVSSHRCIVKNRESVDTTFACERCNGDLRGAHRSHVGSVYGQHLQPRMSCEDCLIHLVNCQSALLSTIDRCQSSKGAD